MTRKGPIGIGIAGLGRSGWDIHAMLLEQLKDKYRIVAVCDPNTGRLKEASDRFGCRTYGTPAELMGDTEVELFVNATPSNLHASVSIEALEAGKSVVCEKPMATKLADADRMMETSRKTGRLLTIFQNRRYSPEFVKLREVVASGKLGRIVMIHSTWQNFSRRWDWQTLKEFGGGTLNNTGPHIVDQALLLLGEKEPEVFCHLERVLSSGDADDHVKILLRAPGAPLIDIEVTSVCAYPQEPWIVMGTQGTLAGNTNSLRWKYFDPKDLPSKPVDHKPTPDRRYNSETISWKEETWSIEKEPGVGSAGFYLDLYDTLRKGAPLAITPDSVRHQIALIEKCHRMCPV